MKKQSLRIISFLFVATILSFAFSKTGETRVEKEGEKYFIVDRTGERWDITQAVSIGFDPYKFEFGIGRHAFRPLDDSDWDSGSGQTPSNLRVIGIAGEGDAHAYAVKRLRYHETANTFLGADPVVAGY